MKTPIMLLHEVMAKHCEVPVYDEVSCSKDTRMFIIRVKCKNHSVNGSGSSKKEAKQSASLKMLMKLIELGVISKNVLLQLPENQSPVKDVIPVAPTEGDSVKINTDTVAKFVNYVGLLQEYCANADIPPPSYAITNKTGPQHMCTFTMTCSLSDIREEATASSKKDAKHQVAKKMLKHIKGDITDLKNEEVSPKILSEKEKTDLICKLGLKVVDLKINDPEICRSKMSRALSSFKDLSHKSIIRATNSIPIDQYHTALRDSCSKSISKNCKARLISLYENQCLDNIDECKNVIRSAFNEFQTINFLIHCKDQFMIGIRVNTTPTVLTVGIGKTKQEAERQALYKFCELVSLCILSNY